MSQGFIIEQPVSYTVRIDENIDGYTYIGKAVPGALDADTTWQIQRINSNNSEVLFADGVPDFAYSWSSRTELDYL